MVWDALWGTVEGWIVIAVTLLSVAVALGLRIFIRKQINKNWPSKSKHRAHRLIHLLANKTSGL